MRFWLARRVSADSCFQCPGRQQPFGCNNGSLAVDPLGLARVAPWAFTRQSAGDEADALPLLLDEAVVRPYPTAPLAAFLPRGVVPDQPQGLLAHRREFVTAPGPKLRREPTDRLARGKAQPELFRRRRCGPQQQAVAGQCLGVGSAPGPGCLDQPQAPSRRPPAVQLGRRQAAPPDLSPESQHPGRMLGRQAAQAVALVFSLAYAGSGLVIQRLARLQ